MGTNSLGIMRIISKNTLVQFWLEHANAKEQLEAWYKETEKADWKTTEDIKRRYPSASFLNDNRVCFNIGGNNLMEIKLIKTEEEYKEALKLAEELFDSEPDTPDGDKLDLVVTLIEKYEKEHFPIDDPSPIEAIKFRMDQMGLSAKDLVPFIGNKSKVSEILSGKRTLSLNMIRRLSEGLDIPLEILIKPYDAIA